MFVVVFAAKGQVPLLLQQGHVQDSPTVLSTVSLRIPYDDMANARMRMRAYCVLGPDGLNACA